MLQMEENEDFNKILNERLDSVTTDGECQQVLRPKACGSCGLLCDVFFLLMRSCCKQIVLIFPPPSPPPRSSTNPLVCTLTNVVVLFADAGDTHGGHRTETTTAQAQAPTDDTNGNGE